MHLLRGETKQFRGENRTRESRRAWLERMAALGLVGAAASKRMLADSSVTGAFPKTKWSAPGLFPGKVVAVEHPGSIVNGVFQRGPIDQMINRGMIDLTGAPDATAAWRMFFQPGERVGIKLNPVSRPYVVSSPETLQAIIAGLESAGVKRNDIFIYDRYKAEFFAAGFDKWAPEGVQLAWATEEYDPTQQGINGYDPDFYMDMQLTLPGFDLTNDRARRSYAAQFITKKIDKMVNLCLLKHHQSAGLTIALKNMSHGLVNNVNRSHSSAMLNTCGAFIPTSVAIPVIRNKNVLNICDAVKALYHGGPGLNPKKAKYVWEQKTMYFSTDPVAIDKIGWEVLDRKRAEMGMAPLAVAVMDDDSRFVRMQPEHVDIAGALGLGESDPKKIQLQKVSLS